MGIRVASVMNDRSYVKRGNLRGKQIVKTVVYIKGRKNLSTISEELRSWHEMSVKVTTWIQEMRKKAPEEARYFFDKHLGDFIYVYDTPEDGTLKLYFNKIPSKKEIENALVAKSDKGQTLLANIIEEFEKIITLHAHFKMHSFDAGEVFENVIDGIKEVTERGLDPIDTSEEYFIMRSKETIAIYFEWYFEIFLQYISDDACMHDQPVEVRKKSEIEQKHKDLADLKSRVQNLFGETIASHGFLILNVIDNILNGEDDDIDIEDTLLLPEDYFLADNNCEREDLTGIKLVDTDIDIDLDNLFKFPTP